jgi:hypothetical protein
MDAKAYILAQSEMPLVYLYEPNTVVETVKAEEPNSLEPDLASLVIECYSEYGAKYQLGRIGSGWYNVTNTVYATKEAAVAAAKARIY